MIEAKMADGTILRFPAGTPDDVVDRAAAEYAQSAGAQSQQPGMGQSFVRGLGLGARDAIQGVAQLPGMLWDAARPLIPALPGTMTPTGQSRFGALPSADAMASGAANLMGLPKPQTDGEKTVSAINRNVAGLIPSMAAGAALQGGRLLGTFGGQEIRSAPGPMAGFVGTALTTAPASQLVGAGAAGAAGEEAAQAGWSPAQQFGASLAGGITGAAVPTLAGMAGRGIASMVQPFTEQGRQKIVGEALLRNSADPQSLTARLVAGADDDTRRLPGSPVTAAVAARDPQMLMLEAALRSDGNTTPGTMSSGAMLRNVDAQRDAVRTQTIEALQRGDFANPTARGDAIRTGLESAESAMRARTNQLFEIARDRSAARVPVGNITQRAQTALNVFDEKMGGGGVPSELQTVLDDIAKLGTLNFDQAQNIRSRLGDIAGDASVKGNARLARAAGAVQDAIEQEMADPRWMAAVAQRRAQGQALGRDQAGAAASASIMRTDKYGSVMRTSDDAIRDALKTPQAARQVLEAGFKALEDARAARLPGPELEALAQNVRTMRQAMRDQFADNLAGASRTTTDIVDATGNVTRQLSPAQFSRWWDKNRAVADVLFDGAERKALDRLAADFAETTISGTARARGSDTAQNLSVGNFIARLTNGTIDPQNPLAQSMGRLGPVAEWIVGAPNQAMREMLVQALRDPQFAAQLTQKAGADSLGRAMLYWQQTMPERVRDATLGALAREVPRIGLSEPSTGRGPTPRLTGR